MSFAEHLNHSGAVDSPQPIGLLPTDDSDREALMRTITFLSTQNHRIKLILDKEPMVDDDTVRSFDPIIAENHIQRLENLLAQMSLLRESDKRAMAKYEAELHDVRYQRAQLLRHNKQRDDLVEKLENKLATHNSLMSKVHDLEVEVSQLRGLETTLLRDLTAARTRTLRTDDVAVVVRSDPRGGCDVHIAFLEMDETAERQDLLLDMLFDPLTIAFDAGLQWMAQREQLAVENEAHLSQFTNSSQQLERDALVAHSEHEALKQRVLFDQAALSRTQRLLEFERTRCEKLVRDHLVELQDVYNKTSSQRQTFFESLLPDFKAQLAKAFQDGRLDRQRRREQRVLRRDKSEEVPRNFCSED